MRILLSTFAVLTALISGCTKRNENLCCIDEADCNQIGESNVVPCNDGFVCRGNLCIAIACTSNADCDATAPFCDTSTGRCDEVCATDSQCPGFGGDPALSVCEGGTCLECRDQNQCGGVRPACVSNVCVECDDDSQCGGAVAACVNNECIECRDDAQCPESSPACVSNQCLECRDDSQCDGATPICDGNACRACVSNNECASNICAENGACVGEDEISHVAPNGSPTSQCTALEPCTLSRGLEFVTTRPYVVLADGNYVTSGSLNLSYGARVIGNPAARPTIRNGELHDEGIFRVATNADASIENVVLADASGSLTQYSGSAVLCISTAKVALRNVRVENSFYGAYVRNCEATIVGSEFVGNNSGVGVRAYGGVAKIERSLFFAMGTGVQLGASAVLRNSILARSGTAVTGELGAGTALEFNTIVDNNIGVVCPAGAFTDVVLSNSILASNATTLDGEASNCLTTTSAVSNSVDPFNFVRANTDPYDYHITVGSQAQDEAVGGDNVLVDFDGQPRPAGAARDLGADELQ